MSVVLCLLLIAVFSVVGYGACCCTAQRRIVGAIGACRLEVFILVISVPLRLVQLLSLSAAPPSGRLSAPQVPRGGALPSFVSSLSTALSSDVELPATEVHQLQ